MLKNLKGTPAKSPLFLPAWAVKTANVSFGFRTLLRKQKVLLGFRQMTKKQDQGSLLTMLILTMHWFLRHDLEVQNSYVLRNLI